MIPVLSQPKFRMSCQVSKSQIPVCLLQFCDEFFALEINDWVYFLVLVIELLPMNHRSIRILFFCIIFVEKSQTSRIDTFSRPYIFDRELFPLSLMPLWTCTFDRFRPQTWGVRLPPQKSSRPSLRTLSQRRQAGKCPVISTSLTVIF